MIKSFGNLSMQIHQSPLGFNAFCSQFSKKNQFKLIGQGMFSDVYGSNDSKYVYKIGIIEKTAQTDPYLLFLSQAQPNNPFFPKVRTVTIFKHKEKDFYVVEMEKLQRCIPKKLDNISVNIFKVLCNLFETRDANGVQKLWKSYCEKFQNNQIIYYVLNAIRELLKKFANDLHAANMMMRSNGQLVITDPVCPKNIITPSAL